MQAKSDMVQQNSNGNIQRQKDVLRRKTLQRSTKSVIQPHVSSLTAKSSDIIQRRTTGEKFATGAPAFANIFLWGKPGVVMVAHSSLK